jgi:hypothetical protein
MRFYDIQIGGGKSYTSRNNPNALNVEFDINKADADSTGGATAVIWGVSLQDISQANDLANKSVTVSGGMQQGLPLATLQSANAGVLIKGYIFQSFGNWVGTEMWLTLVMIPGDPPKQAPAPNAPNPPPKNITLNWTKGTMLSDALQQALQPAYQGLKLNINISKQLVAPQDNVGFYPNLRDLNNYLRGVSQQLMNHSSTYPGVGCCVQNGELTVHDGTSPPSPKMIQFTDLVGQPTWIYVHTIQVKVVMRGDLNVGDQITLPPTRIVTTTEAQSGVSEAPLTFSGTFKIQNLRHVGNFRIPDGAAWITIIEAIKS